MIKKAFTIFLVFLLFFNKIESNKLNAIPSVYGPVLLLMFVNETFKNNDDFKKHCKVDPLYLITGFMDSSSPKEEWIACYINTTMLMTLTLATYYGTYYSLKTTVSNACVVTWGPTITPAQKASCDSQGDLAGTAGAVAYTVAAISAYIGILYTSSVLAQNRVKVCGDTNFSKNFDSQTYTNAPYAYTDDQISAILKKTNGSTPSRNEIASKYKQLCVIDHRNNVRWLEPGDKSNTCFWLDGVNYCTFKLKGNASILCLRTSSPCPCKHNIQEGQNEQPVAEISNSGYTYDQNGDIKMNNTNNKFLIDCRQVRSDYHSEDWEDNNIIDISCKDGVGSSKNDILTIFSATASCIINTMKNLLFKEIVMTPLFVPLNNEAQTQIDGLYSDKLAINILARKMNMLLGDLSLNPNKVPAIYSDSSFINIQNDMKLLKGISSPNATMILKQYPLYEIKAGDLLSNKPFITIMPLITIDDQIAFIQALDAINTTLPELMKHLDNQAFELYYGNGGNTGMKKTFFAVLQSICKGSIIIMFVIYIMFIGLKLMTGELELKGKDIIHRFIMIGVIFYFAMFDGWREFGMNFLLRLSSNIFKIVLTSTSFVSAGDGCDRDIDSFILDQTVVTSTFESSALNCIKDLRNCKFIDSNTLQNINDFCSINHGKNRIFFSNNLYRCLRGNFNPKPSYLAPLVPVPISSDLSSKIASRYNVNYTETYFPVRCITETGDNLFCIDSQCSKVETTGFLPYFAHFKSKGRKEFMSCDKSYRDSLGQNKQSYLADGYNADDLALFGLIDLNWRTTCSKITFFGQTFGSGPFPCPSNNDIYRTGFYITDFNGRAVPNGLYDTSTSQFSQRITSIILSKMIDDIRLTYNKLYKGYPEGEEYLAGTDYIGCIIEKSLLMENKNDALPVVLNLSIRIIFSSIIGIIPATIMIVFVITIVGIGIKITQNLTVGLSGLIFMLYLSPIILPFALFEHTKKVYEDWITKIKGYLIYPPISFILIPVIGMIIKTALYGKPGSLGHDTLFDNHGHLRKDCLTFTSGSKPTSFDDIQEFPYLCLVYTMAENNKNVAFGMMGALLFPATSWVAIIAMATIIAVDAGSNSTLIKIIIYKSIIVLVMITIASDVFDKFEETLSEILDGIKLDVEGGIKKLSSLTDPTKIASGLASIVKNSAVLTRSVGSRMNTAARKTKPGKAMDDMIDKKKDQMSD